MPKIITEKEKNELELQWFRILVGMHVGADFSVEPKEMTDPATGEKKFIYQSKKYQASPNNPTGGDVFQSDVDLVVKHGGSKFDYANDPEEERQVRRSMRNASRSKVAEAKEAKKSREEGREETAPDGIPRSQKAREHLHPSTTERGTSPGPMDKKEEPTEPSASSATSGKSGTSSSTTGGKGQSRPR